MKTLNLFLLFLYLIFTNYFLNAQIENHANIWYFGDTAGLDFNYDPTIVLFNGITNSNHGVTTAIMCDSSGNIVLYTDGDNVYNSEHHIIENGTNLKGAYST